MNTEPVENTLHMSTPPNSNENRRKEIDEIFLEIGPCAKFQILFQAASIYLSLTVGYNFVLSFFTGKDGDWSCISNNSSRFCQENYNKSFTVANENFYQRCNLERSEWNYSVPGTYSFVTEFDLVCEKRSIAALLSASYYIGGLIGSVVSGNVADTFGRKPVILISLLVIFCSSIGSSFVMNIWQLFGLSIVQGAASVACYFTVFVYQLEFVSSAYRAISGTILQVSMSGSFLLVDAVAYYERHWRKLHIYTSLPCIISFFMFAFVPESPRWLMSTGKVTRSTNIMKYITKFNGNSSVIPRVKSPRISQEKTYNYLHLCCNCQVLILTLSIGCMWLAIALVMYTLLLGSSNLGGDMYQTFALAILADVPSWFISPYLSNRIGRKKTILGCLSLTGVLVGCMALVSKLSTNYYISIGLTLTAKSIGAIPFLVIYTWTFELFPTALRSQGMSVCIIFERVGIFLVPFITKILQSVSHRLPFIVMCVFALVSSMIGLTLPETNNKPTREKYEDFFTIPPNESSHDCGVDNVSVQSPEVEEAV